MVLETLEDFGTEFYLLMQVDLNTKRTQLKLRPCIVGLPKGLPQHLT